LAGGFASTVSWPVTHLLIDSIGWRGCYLVYAAVLVLINAPLHALLLPRERVDAETADTNAARKPAKLIPAKGLTFALVASAFACYAFVPSGLSAHLLAIFQRNGIDAGTAVWIGALFGPAQVLARLIEFSFGRDVHPLWVARFAFGALLVAFVLLALTGMSTGVAAVFALMFGGANGLVTIARGAVPLTLFGATGYGRLMGRLAGPFLLVQSAAPLVMAFVIERVSDVAALMLAAAFATVAFVCSILIRRPV
jgi:predicted MFS family arabinose efflux permease